MVHYARLRPRLSKLTFAWIWLGLVSAGVSFASTYQLVPWQKYTVWSVAAVLAVFLWLLPSLKFAATFVDVTSTGVLISKGFGSARRIELNWAQIASVTVSPIKGILIRTKDEAEHGLRGYSSQKAIAVELQSLLGGK